MTGEQLTAGDLPIIFDGVGFIANAVSILERVTLQIWPGTPTVIIGPNGSGKTTLLRLAMGLLAPTQGRITWAGQGFDPNSRRSFMFQRPTMLRRSVAGNLLYSLNAAAVPRILQDARVEELLALVGLQGLGARWARRLSGGEQQRVALARALAKDPAVVFLDEPTASLDPAQTKSFEDVVRSVVDRGIKVVMSTHDLGEARRLAGEIVMLHQGRVIEMGGSENFFQEPQTPEARKFLAGDLLV
ncbi:MAG: ATP-binding cassette domain-containing protein [Steroidobacteraceae bacterium]